MFNMLSFSQDDIIFWSGFLEKYRELKCLWSKQKLYDDKDQYRIERQSAYLELLKYCRMKYPKADVNFVTQKLQYFGSLFNKSYKKVLKCREQGVTFTPNLWYYKNMLFLIEDDANKVDNQTNLPIIKTNIENLHPQLENSNESVNPTSLDVTEIKIERIDHNEFNVCNGLDDYSNVPIINAANSNDNCIENVSEQSDTNLFKGIDPPNCYANEDIRINDTLSDSRNQRKSIKRRRKNSTFDYLAVETLKEVQKLSKEDEFDIAGRKLAYDLRQMSKEQKILTERILSEVVYNAKCNLLKSSYIFKPSTDTSSGEVGVNKSHLNNVT